MIRIVEFETRYAPGKDPVDWVCLAPQGEAFLKTQTWHRVAELNPANFRPHKREGMSYEDAKAKWSVIGPAYEAWRAGNEIPTTGTPLEVWAALSPEQVKLLKALDVRTVEDVRDMGDNTMSKLRMPNARQLPKLAADFLSGATSAEKDAKIAELEERMAAMTELLEERLAAEKPKRGRPPKEKAEAA